MDEDKHDEGARRAEGQWQRIRSRLRAELGDAIFDSWFRQVALGGVVGDCVVLYAPSRFARSWLEAHHVGRILSHWQTEGAPVKRVDIELHPDWGRAARETKSATSQSAAAEASIPLNPLDKRPARKPTAAQIHDDVGAPLDPRFTFENFIVGASNEMAHAAAKSTAETHNPSANPFFLYSGTGLGKTHLMQAIAWKMRHRNPSHRIVYLSAEKFMYQFVRALRVKDTLAFKQQFREVDMLLVDDIQFVAGKESTQEELFHTLAAVMDHNGQVVVSADRAPQELEGLDARIRSRLAGGLAVDIRPTDHDLRVRILQSKVARLAVRLPDAHIPASVIDFLAQRIDNNVREVEGAFNRVVAYASFVNRPVTLEMAQDVLRDLLRASERRVTISDIQRRVAEYYGIKVADMLSARRMRSIARPRQIAMYLAKQLTTRSLPEIGRKFGGRDHTTVIHAVRRIEELRAEDPALDEDVDLLSRMLEG